MAIGLVKHFPIKSFTHSVCVASRYINGDYSDTLMAEYIKNGTLSDSNLSEFLKESGINSSEADSYRFANALAEMSHILGIKSVAKGLSYNFSYKKEVAYSHFYLPDFSPDRFLNCPDNHTQRLSFWTEVETNETKLNSHYADAFIFALPNEFYLLPKSEQDKLEKQICDSIATIFISYGHACDIAVHRKSIENIMYKKKIPVLNPDGSQALSKTGRPKYKQSFVPRYTLTDNGWIDCIDNKGLSQSDVAKLNNYHIHCNVCNRAFSSVTHDWSLKATNSFVNVDNNVMIPIARKTKDVSKLCKAYESYFDGKVNVSQSSEHPTKLIFTDCDSTIVGQRIPLIDNTTYQQKYRGNHKEWQRVRVSIADYMNHEGLIDDIKSSWNTILNSQIDTINKIYSLDIEHIDCRSYEQRALDNSYPMTPHIPVPRPTHTNQEHITYIKELNTEIDALNKQSAAINALKQEIKQITHQLKQKISFVINNFFDLVKQDFFEKISPFVEKKNYSEELKSDSLKLSKSKSKNLSI